MKNKIIIIIIFLISTVIFAQSIMKCNICNKEFPNDYKYCPFCAHILEQINKNTKDINGFQDFKWGMDFEEIKTVIKKLNINNNIIRESEDKIKIKNFTFLNKEANLTLSFYKEKLYKTYVYFVVEDNVAGMNEYFSIAGLIKEIYGNTDKIAIGEESSNYNHRAIQISIGDLSYQYKWFSISGNLTFQLSSSDSRHFICSLFYSSNESEIIDKEKEKAQF
jgi:hypothetical protein